MSVTYFVLLGINIETMSICYGEVMWKYVNDRQLFWIILLPRYFIYISSKMRINSVCPKKYIKHVVNLGFRFESIYSQICPYRQPYVVDIYVCVGDDLSRLSFYQPTRVNTIKFYYFFFHWWNIFVLLLLGAFFRRCIGLST